MFESLTRRQHELHRWLCEHALAGGAPPTLDEICAGFGLRSRGSLHKHITALVEAGLVHPLDGLRRGVRLRTPPLPELEQSNGLPLLGFIAAGRPIEAVTDNEWVEVPARLQGRGECYVLEVRGNSMRDAGILDRDWVVVEHRTTAHNGEIVVALIDGESATLKRIEQRDGECILHAANDEHAPQRYHPEQVQIQGVLTGLVRSYGR